MIETVTLENFSFTYSLKRSKRIQSLRIRIERDGSVTCTLPYRINEDVARKFIFQKKSWIEEKLLFYQENRKEKQIHSSSEILEYKKQTLALVKERLSFFNNHYGLVWKDIRIKDTKTRWGSCSKIGNLNFNYKIALLSKDLTDYIVVHELCHLREFNHSSSFWSLVEKTIPNHKNLRKELKKKSLELI